MDEEEEKLFLERLTLKVWKARRQGSVIGVAPVIGVGFLLYLNARWSCLLMGADSYAVRIWQTTSHLPMLAFVTAAGLLIMNWNDALGAAIEVAIAIAGFSGIVVAVGHRKAGNWNADDQVRLQTLLTASGVAGVFAFLPFILLDTDLDPELSWRIGSGTQVIWLIGIPIYRLRQALRMGATAATFTDATSRVILPLLILVIVLLLINAVVLAATWPYVVGVLYQLTVAFAMFVRLLLDSGTSSE